MISIEFSPLFSWPVVLGLAVAALLPLAYGAWRRASGLGWRAIALAVLLLALANPVAVEEEREKQNDVLAVLVDESASQNTQDREKVTRAALDHIRKTAGNMRNLEVRVIRAGGPGSADADRVDGTRLFRSLIGNTADIPSSRRAGTIVITDGQVHDIPDNPASRGLKGPFHVVLTGKRGEFDRRLVVEKAPKFGIVGKETEISIRVEDNGPNAGPIPLSITKDGGPPRNITVRPGQPEIVRITPDHAGENIIQMEVRTSPGELTEINNRAVVSINGVRERLRVLLVSGEPHPGERTWRNLLKADPSVDLVHFTILRPPEKQDLTPVRELSLIAFPIRELFEVKLEEFDLIIFDRYRRRGVLPSVYIDNIRRYVENGGAILEAAGPEFASMETLYATPLGKILPGEPTGRVYAGAVRPQLTTTGERHAVTADLPGAGIGEELPRWGKWFRQIEVRKRAGYALMRGNGERPILLVNRVGKGRVAQLLSDHIWLWARGYNGGGPHGELLRRIAHWLMKEPELEENSLRARVDGDRLAITRRSVEPNPDPVEVTTPSGRQLNIRMTEGIGGRARGFVAAPETGVYRIKDGDRVTLTAVGTLNPLEFADMRTTAEKFAPLVAKLGGGIAWWRDGPPSLRRVRPGRVAGGDDWFGILDNRNYTVRNVNEIPLFPGLLVLLAGLGALLLAWRREGR